jgi:hypothetical protein
MKSARLQNLSLLNPSLKLLIQTFHTKIMFKQLK